MKSQKTLASENVLTHSQLGVRFNRFTHQLGGGGGGGDHPRKPEGSMGLCLEQVLHTSDLLV